MVIGLGIDTGGTYTDAVIVDLATKNILAKGKVPTDLGDLFTSIIKSIKTVGKAALKADFVALSTTLSTNAIVEGQGAAVCLIAIGSRLDIEGLLPPGEVEVVGGGHRIDGSQAMELDEDALVRIARRLAKQVEAIAISSYLSVRNPEHELQAKAIIEQITDLPVVCGHELTTLLGYRERTATALLNAKLIPLSKKLLIAVKEALSKMGITAPLMAVKSDGALVDAEQAMLRPVQTILSGPAAGITGSLFLADVDSGLVVDMGGTTTDLSLITGRRPRLNKEGATVGRWRTRVKSVDVTTFGLGGDSYIWSDKQKRIQIGPKRVLPLAYLAFKHPPIIPKLEEVLHGPEIKALWDEPQDFIYLKTPFSNINLTRQEKGILAVLKSGPLLVNELAINNNNPRRILRLSLQRLEGLGIVGRAGLTPTDILHSSKQLELWDSEASAIAVSIMSRYLQIDRESFEETVLRKLEQTFALEIVKKYISDSFSDGDAVFCRVCERLINATCGHQKNKPIQVSIHLKMPVIGVGAPIGAYLPGVARLLDAEYIVPVHADVAGAVGAATANVVEVAYLLIENATEGGYNIYSPWGKFYFETLEEAKAFAVDLGVEKITEKALKSGASRISITKSISDKKVSWGSESTLYLGTEIKITANGPPRFQV